MSKHLRAFINECRRVLEPDLQPYFREAGFASVKEATLACFLELSAIQCFESRIWHTPSCLSAGLNAKKLHQQFLDARRRLRLELSFLPKRKFEAPSPSPKILSVIARYFQDGMTSEEWRSDHLLGWLYQFFDDEPIEQKQRGRFYTPGPVAEYITHESLATFHKTSDTSPLSVLDLACGAGMFALKAFDALYQRSREAGRGGALAQQLLGNQLFLVDRDPWACYVAALNLVLKAKSLEPECTIDRLNIFCADALRRWEYDGNVELRKLFSTRFDLVLGNPPYIVINQLKAAKEDILQYKSYASAAYKINTFALFIERGLDLLKPSGTLGMIVPNTLLTQIYFEALRKYILNTSRIGKIFDTKRMFENAFVENCIILLQRDENAVRRRQSVVECLLKEPVRAASQCSGDCERIVRIPQRHFEKAPFMMFNVRLDEATFALLEKIADGHSTLGDICESHDGVNPGNAKHKLLVNEQLDEHCRKILNGKNIGRYRLNWDGLYVRYNRRLLAKGDNVRWGHQASLDGPKILTRQTADRIIGTYEEGEYYATNSIHTTILRHDAKTAFSLKYVLALLNSKVLSFYYRKLISEVGQVFCQVKLVHLRQLPLRRIPLQEQQSFVDAVEALLALELRLQDTTDDERRSGLQLQIVEHDRKLDRGVYALYRLSPEEIRLIEEEFPHFT